MHFLKVEQSYNAGLFHIYKLIPCVKKGFKIISQFKGQM